ncbi:MAG: hypothetical protein AAGH67_08615 [Cyanobacteria bacterium P01_H01_bin.162]
MIHQSSRKNEPLSPIERARAGDIAAIAALINRSFQKQGIRIEVVPNRSTLEVSLYGKIPPSKRYIDVLKSGLTRIGVTRFTHLVVDSYQQDSCFPTWVETITLVDASASTADTAAKPTKAIQAAIAPYRPQWQELQAKLPRILRDPKIFAAVFVGSWLLMIFQPLTLVGIVLIASGVWWLQHRNQPQNLPVALQKLPAVFKDWPWEWLAALFGLLAWVANIKLAMYAGIISSLVAIALLCWRGLAQWRHHATPQAVADCLLLLNLHLLLTALLLLRTTALPADFLSTVAIVLGGAMMMQVGGRMGQFAIVANIIITLLALLFVMHHQGPGIYASLDRPYYDTQGFKILFGFFALIATSIFIGLFSGGSLVLGVFGHAVTRNASIGYGLVLVGPYLSWLWGISLTLS